MNPGADHMADVIPLPVPLREPNWDVIDRVARELGLWDDTPPPRLRVVRD